MIDDIDIDIDKIKRKLLIKYPYFGSLMSSITFKKNNSIPTAGTDGKTIYYNSKFLSKLSIEQQLFVIAHEVCHIAFNHILRSKGRDQRLWNIATDAVINAFLMKDGLQIVDGAVNIEDAIKYDAEELYEKLLKEKQEKEKQKKEKQEKQQNGQKNQEGSSQSSKQQSDQQSGQQDNQEENRDQSGQNGQDKDEPKQQEDKKEENQGESGQQDQEDEKEENESESEQQEQENQEKNQSESGQQEKEEQEEEQEETGHASHDMWKKALEEQEEKEKGSDENSENKEEEKDKNESETDKSDNEKEASKSKKDNDEREEEQEKISEKEIFKTNEEIRKKLLDELRESISNEISAGKSTNSAHLRLQSIGRSKPLIDWRVVLKETIRMEIDWSYRNAEIEDGVVRPHLEEFPQPETEIVLDTSGSINETLLKNFLRECKNILETSKVKVGCFDVNFYGFKVIRNVKDIDQMEFVGRGGTDFDVAVRAFTKRVENKIIFTDGRASMPDIPMDCIWIVYGGNEIKPEGGKVIYITDEMLEKLCFNVEEKTMTRVIKK